MVLGILWVYVSLIGDPENVDKLRDPAYAAAAEPVCKATLGELARQGVVNKQAASPQERAALVDRSDAELAGMVGRLRAIPVTDPEDAKAVTLWLADWDQWLADRAVWAAQLRQGSDVEFLEKQREETREPNSKALNDFALVNSMRSCATPGGI